MAGSGAAVDGAIRQAPEPAHAQGEPSLSASSDARGASASARPARPAARYDLAVIGQGPAGMTAALYAARAGLSVAAFEQLGPGGQVVDTEHLDNYPGFAEGVGAFDLAFAMSAQAARFGAASVNDEVVSLDAAAAPKLLTCASGSVYAADAVVVATGARPRPLGIAGEDTLRGRGVSYCATCDGGFFRGREVAVVGGGNTAVGDAIYLARICERVHLIHRRGAFRADAVYTDALAGLSNVELHLNSEVSALHEEGGALSGVSIRPANASGEASGPAEALPVAALFVAVGTMPTSNLAVAAGVSVDERGYIVADETGVTNVPGVFAAGDVRTKALRQVITAASDGANAATAAFEYLSVARRSAS